MKEFKRELITYLLLIFVIIIVVLSFLGCTQLEVEECYCIVKTTKEKVSIINGIPRTTYTTSTEKWGSDCSQDGIQFANSIIICN